MRATASESIKTDHDHIAGGSELETVDPRMKPTHPFRMANIEKWVISNLGSFKQVTKSSRPTNSSLGRFVRLHLCL